MCANTELKRNAGSREKKEIAAAEIKPMTSGSEVNRLTTNKARAGPRSAAWFLKSLVKLIIFQELCINVTIAQLI